MGWPHIAAFTLAAIGAVGVCLMVTAFVMIARQGGWQQAIQQPIEEGRWPVAKRLLLVGAILAAAFCVGIFILGLIPGGVPWRN